MNWFNQPTDDLNYFNFQLPQPQLLLISSGIYEPELICSDHEMAFEAADFMSEWNSRKEEELRAVVEKAPKVAEKKKLKPRYQKNICGYILKKALRAFVSDSYRNVVVETCAKYEASYEQARVLCMARMETVYGPSHLRLLLVPSTREEIAVKKTITQFLEWFLAQRYTRHLILEGKMDNKEKYILYKNKFFPKEIGRFKRMTENFISSL